MSPILYIDCVRSQATFLPQEEINNINMHKDLIPSQEEPDDIEDPNTDILLDQGEKELITNQKKDN